MSNVGYLVTAYIGAALLYGGYVARLLMEERRLERRSGGRAR